MEEPRSTGSEPAKRTTDKLPTENIATNNTTTQATSNNNSQQNQAPTTVDSLQLVVVEGFQVGRGVARIDSADIAKLGCQPGDIVLITGARTSAAKIVPGAMVDRGQQTIQMDSQVRQNSASGLGERVTVRKAKVRAAEKIALLPLSGGAIFSAARTFALRTVTRSPRPDALFWRTWLSIWMVCWPRSTIAPGTILAAEVRAPVINTISPG